jgi:ABC-type Fe3+/spermidine/putrescine transport system ATPase subunit
VPRYGAGDIDTAAASLLASLERQGATLVAPPARKNATDLEFLALIGLTGYGDRDVADLSGGEKQRVALARTLATRAALLMLDESLGSRDRTLRERCSKSLPAGETDGLSEPIR